MAANSRFAIAVHILTLLARYAERPVKSDFLAQSVNTNPVVIRRLLCTLAQAGLVASQTGAAGGSWLARPAAQISLNEVYRAVEAGHSLALPRRKANAECPVGRHIEDVLTDVIRETERACERVLAQVTIAQVLRTVGPCGMPREEEFNVIL